jgi:hypothetical protein
MKLVHILIPFLGSASFPSILAAPAPDANEAQLGMSSNVIVAGLTRRFQPSTSHIDFSIYIN